MFSELLIVIGTLGVVVIGLLIMVRAITFEKLIGALGKVIAFALAAFTAFWILQEMFVAFVLPWLFCLRSFFGWLVLFCLTVIALALMGRIAVSKFQNRVAGSTKWEE